MHRLNPHDQKDQQSQPLEPSPAYVERFLILVIISASIALVAWGGWYLRGYFKGLDLEVEQAEDVNLDLADVEKSVVNIICPEAEEAFDFSEEHIGGTGYVLDESGKVLTNFHIIASEDDPRRPMNLHEKGCFVLFPDTGTGYSNDTYIAKPIYYRFLSPEYDFAFMQIYDVYTEEGQTYGVYPKTFDPLDLKTCKLSELAIGDDVFAMGYPGATEGYSLTMVKGIVSAFSSYDSFYSTANLGLGGSGGIVVAPDRNCLAGIYSGLVYDDHVSYGEVYSTDSILEFMSKTQHTNEPGSLNREKTEDL